MRKNIRFNLKKVAIEQFAILADFAPDNKEAVQLQTSIAFKANGNSHLVACEAGFVFENGGQPFMKLAMMCHFEVEPNDWASLIQDNGIVVIPKGFLCHLAMLTIGTARGILFSKTENTDFNRYLIPLINVEKIVTEDFTVKE